MHPYTSNLSKIMYRVAFHDTFVNGVSAILSFSGPYYGFNLLALAVWLARAKVLALISLYSYKTLDSLNDNTAFVYFVQPHSS